MTRLSKLLLSTAALAMSSTAALAHPGHVTGHGHGHDHWLAIAIFGGLGIAALLYGLWRLSSRPSSSDMSKNRTGRDD